MEEIVKELLPEEKYRAVFIVGKGGVGKTTIAASLAVKMADEGRNTLIISIDPAHNLGDVLGVKLSDRKKEVIENLYALEVDVEKLINRYLSALSERLKSMYHYLSVLNVEKYFDVIRYSPGIEEYAVLDYISKVLRENEDSGEYDVIIFDTPPTGLTLRVLTLPSLSLEWVKRLVALRIEILKRRAALKNIRGETRFRIGDQEYVLPTSEEEDEILHELRKYGNELDGINSVFQNEKKSTILSVINPEMLPLLETLRAEKTLRKFGMRIKLMFVNKVMKLKEVPEELKPKIVEQGEVIKKIKEELQAPMVLIPYLSKEPRGVEDLRKLLKKMEPPL